MKKIVILLIGLSSLSSSAFADLSKVYKTTQGEALASCIERKIPLVDRINVADIRSFTKYDKHYVSLSTHSIFVDYGMKEKALTLIYVNNYSVERETKAEQAKNNLLDIKSRLFEPALKICKDMLEIKEDVKYSMVYMDPPNESRKLKAVIKMNEEGSFLLP